jgi:fucose permease
MESLRRPPRIALVLVAFVAFVSLGLPDGVLGLAWPTLRETFAVPVSWLPVLIAAGTCGYLVSSFSSGLLVRGLGVGKLLLMSGLLVVAASAAYAAAPAFTLLIVAGFVSGLGGGAVDAGINAYAAHHFSPRVVNWLHAFYGVGASLGTMQMTAVLSSGHSWRLGYAVNACALAVMCVCFLLTLKLWDTPTESHETVADAPGTLPPPPGTVATLSRPVVMLSVLLFFLYTGTEVAAGQWTYSLFTMQRRIPDAPAGAAVSAYWVSLTIGRILFGVVAAHLPPIAIVRGAMLLAPAAALLVWRGPSPVWNFVGLAAMGFCFAPMFPLLISMTPGRVGADAGHQAIGFQISAACLGAAGVPGVAGILAKRFGLEAVGPVLVVACVLLLVVHETIALTARHKTAR